MNSTGIKAIFAITGIVALSATVFSFTATGQNFASVILSTTDTASQCIEELQKIRPNDTFKTTNARINTDSVKDVILESTSEDRCGSAGCIFELCVIAESSSETNIIPFGYAADILVVKQTSSNGMYDIQLQGKSTTNLQWDGVRYTIVQ